MKFRNPITVVILMGGLGNQLFQISAAHGISPKSIIQVDWSTEKNPRLDSQKIPELLRSNFQKILKTTRFSKKSKLFGLIVQLILSIENQDKVSKLHYKFILVPLVNVYLSLRYKYPSRLIHYKNITSKMKTNRFLKPIVIGYFQNYKLISNENVKFIKDNLYDIVLDNHKIVQKKKNLDFPVIVVHMRFGDYLNESSFGIPGIRYYREALKLHLDRYPNAKIMAFSDDKEFAKNYLSKIKIFEFEWFNDEEMTPVEVLLVMSEGTAFVISNSTYSWWAARLSSAYLEDIIVPSPWFLHNDPVLRLIPSEWRKFPSELVGIRMLS